MKTKKDKELSFDYQKSLKNRNINRIDKFIAIEKYVNRPMASLVVRAVINTRITPNGLTYANFFLGLLAAYLLSIGEYLYLVLGGILTQVSSVVDCADGMLARAKNMCSDYGAHLDVFLDRITDFCLIVGMAFGLYTTSSNINILIIGLIGAGLLTLQANLFYLTKRYLNNMQTGETGEARALMLLLIMIFSIFNILEIGIYMLLVEAIFVNLARLSIFIRLGNRKEIHIETNIGPELEA
jgi:phosphatidylglycerophosphate synthase